MAEKHPEALRPNLDLVGVFGRYDDLYELIGTPLEDDMWAVMKKQFEEDLQNLNAGNAISLLAKWIKTADASSSATRKLGILTAQKLGYPVYNFKRIVRSMRKQIGVVEPFKRRRSIMADVNSTTTQNQTQQQSQTAPQNQPTQASGTQQQPQTDKHEENNSGGEVTVESLMAQLAQEKAANAKLKSDNDKLCTSEGNLRKQLRAKQTAEEQEAEAKAEQQAQRDAYVKELEKFKAVAESSERYLGMGMPAEMAKATATAEYEGSMDVVTGNITKFMAERDKQKESEIRAQYLAQMPTPQSGNVGQVDYSAQIKQAMDAGDSQAAILAILSQSAANNQQA
ncbi:MAG: hypothetical protein V8R90_09045 [Eubacterium sp.]